MLTKDEARRIAANIAKLEDAHRRRGATDCSEYRQAAGAVAQVLNALRVYLVKSESSDKPSVVPNRW